MEDNRDYYTDMFKHTKLKINIMIKDTNINNQLFPNEGPTHYTWFCVCKNIVLVDSFLKWLVFCNVTCTGSKLYTQYAVIIQCLYNRVRLIYSFSY